MSAPRKKMPSAVTRFAPPAKSVRRWLRFAKHTPQGWVLGLLDQIDRERALREPHDRHSPGWLLRYRPQFRKVEDSRPAGALRYYLLECPEYMAPMATWLLGRCTSRTQQYDLFEFAVHGSEAARRHAARALRRVEAWSKLRALAAASPFDGKIAWYAQAPVTKRAFRERFKNFAAYVDASHAAEAAGPSRMALWLGDVDWIRRPPKPVTYIQGILRRIKRWVHGAD